MSDETPDKQPFTLPELKAFLEPYKEEMRTILSLAPNAAFAFNPLFDKVLVYIHAKGAKYEDSGITVAIPNATLLAMERVEYFAELVEKMKERLFKAANPALFGVEDKPAFLTEDEQQKYLAKYAGLMRRILQAAPNAVFGYEISNGFFFVVLHPKGTDYADGKQHYILYTSLANDLFNGTLQPAFSTLLDMVLSDKTRADLPLLFNGILL